MANIKPAFEYDTGGGPITITFGGNINSDDKFKPRGRGIRDLFAGSGIRQRNKDFNEERLRLKIEFVSETIIDEIITMMKDHVLAGNTFKYIPDQDTPGTFITVQLLDSAFNPDRMFDTVNIWSFTLNLRKAIT